MIISLLLAAALLSQAQVPEPSGAPVEASAPDLLRMSRAELEALYGRARPGPIPDGESRGRATLDPGADSGGFTERLIAVFWQGKVFKRLSEERGELVNKVLGLPLFKAKVYFGDSLFDGKRSIIIDYSETSLLAAGIRDEIREVAPGEYLGFAYFKDADGGYDGRPLIFALRFSR